MGCDIHGNIEIRPYDWDENEWYCVADISFIIERNYDLFSVLAGVRQFVDIKPITKCKGIPKNASLKTLEHYEYWAGDGHSATFMTLKDIKEYDYNSGGLDEREIIMDSDEFSMKSKPHEPLPDEKKRFVTAKEIFDNSANFQTLFKIMDALALLYGDEWVRLVIWFDN